MTRLRRSLWPASIAVGLAAILASMGGPASAQDPIYDFPTPTGTAPGTPFTSTGPTTPPTPLETTTLRLMSPFPRVHVAGYFTASRTTFTRFTVRGPLGVRVASACTRAQCTLHRKLKTRKPVRLRKLERSFKAGTVIRLRVTAPDAIGKYVVIRLRRGKRPLRRDACLRPGRTKPIRCAAS